MIIVHELNVTQYDTLLGKGSLFNVLSKLSLILCEQPFCCHALSQCRLRVVE